MSTLSKNTKVVLYPDNFLDQGQNVPKSKCMVVQSYEYMLCRSRNAYGEAYGTGSGNIVTIKVRVSSRDSLKVFYDRLSNMSSTCLTLIYNVHYDDQGFVTEYGHDGALVIDGYIIDIEEVYGRSKTERDNEEIMLSLKFLTNSMEMVGSNNNLNFQFNC